MGASISTQVQMFTNNQWVDFLEQAFTSYKEYTNRPFTEQNYGLFAFFADVRNYSCIPVLDEPRGLPAVDEPDFGEGLQAVWSRSDWEPWPEHCDNHSATWFLVSELLCYNYDILFENRRSISGFEETVPAGLGELISIKEYIGHKFFDDLYILQNLGDPTKIRVVISFSN